MAGVGALLVSTSLPANALQSATVDDVAVSTVAEKQLVTVQATTAEIAVSRDGYTVVKPPPPKPAARASAISGAYTNNSNGAVQWPFPSSPIESFYGPRGGTFHYSIDFFPGGGTPVGSITAGVVTHVGTGAGGWGEYVTVQHDIQGQVVQSLYAHMRSGSIGVATGEQISVGQFLGTVGATGRAFGEHLHLEIKVNGANVDPYTWLQTNAG